MSLRCLALPAVVTIGWSLTVDCLAQNYTFRKVVEIGAGYDAIASSPAINNSGTVAFGAMNSSMQQGIFSIRSDGLVTPIALEGGTYTGIGQLLGVEVGTPDINAFGQVAFFASTMVGAGIFVSDGVTTVPITHTTTLGIQPSHLSDRLSINDLGRVAFSTAGSPVFAGVHTGNGGAITTVDPKGNHPSINNIGSVAYSTDLGSGGSNIAVVTTAGRRIVDVSKNQIEGSFPSINDFEEVAFRGRQTGSNAIGVYKGTGVPVGSPQIPSVSVVGDGKLPLTDPGQLGKLAINDLGTVVYWTSVTGTGGGIFTGLDPVADKVIAAGDTFTAQDGSGSISGTMNLVEFSPNGLNDRNQIVFYAQFTKQTGGGPVNSRAIFIATRLLPGDYDESGAVDAADFVLWRDKVGTSIVLPNDTTPGSVTAADYNIWRASFGTTAFVAEGAVVDVVPEMSTGFYFAVAAMSLLTMVRNRMHCQVGDAADRPR